MRPISDNEADICFEEIQERFQGALTEDWEDGDVMVDPADLPAITGAWIVGSAADGTWGDRSPVDIWLRVSGLNEAGRAAIGERISDAQRSGDDYDPVYVLGSMRKLSVHLYDREPDAATIQVEVPIMDMLE